MALKNPLLSAGFQPANLGFSGSTITITPPRTTDDDDDDDDDDYENDDGDDINNRVQLL
jgi:hypothetical protein